MGISQQVGASSLNKPGVCTSTTRPATPYEGQMIYETDTDRVLVWNNSAWVVPNAPAQNPMGLELITTATCSLGGTASGGVVTVGSAQTSVIVDNVFSSLYDNYKIIYNGGVGNSAGGLGLRLTGSATAYSHVLHWSTPGGASVNLDTSTNTTQMNYVGGFTTNHTSLECDIVSPFLTTHTLFNGGQYIAADMGHCIGRHSVVASYTSITMITLSGNVTGGKIRVYGYRNS